VSSRANADKEIPLDLKNYGDAHNKRATGNDEQQAMATATNNQQPMAPKKKKQSYKDLKAEKWAIHWRQWCEVHGASLESYRKFRDRHRHHLEPVPSRSTIYRYVSSAKTDPDQYPTTTSKSGSRTLEPIPDVVM
jgi:hypothetical protein